MTAEEFKLQWQDDDTYWDESTAIEFAEAYADAKNKGLTELLELALKRSTDETLRHLIEQALNKEK